MGKVIAVGSGRGGTGKTTTTAAVSSCLAALGYRTLCLDFAFSLRNLDFALGLTGGFRVDFSELLSGSTSIAKACREHPNIPGLFFYSADTGCDLESLGTAELKPLFKEIRSSFDYCIVDAPSAIDYGYRLAHADADASVIVTTGELPSMGDVERAASVTLDSGVGDLLLVVNRCSPENSKWVAPAIEHVIETVGVQLIGLIPEDRVVLQASHEFVPLILYPKRHAVYHFLDVARRVAGETVPLRMHLSHRFASERPHAPHRPPISRRPLVSQRTYDKVEREKRDIHLDIHPDIHPDIRPDIHPDKHPDKHPEKPDGTLVASRGDPGLWAKSTLPPGEDLDLRKLYVIRPGTFLVEETIRHRMWLHDILDDNEIPYQVDIVGYWPTRKRFVEAQSISVEKQHLIRAQKLVKEFNDPRSQVKEDPGDRKQEFEVVDGVPQKTCASCGKSIDFDYRKCPYCKGLAGDGTVQ